MDRRSLYLKWILQISVSPMLIENPFVLSWFLISISELFIDDKKLIMGKVMNVENNLKWISQEMSQDEQNITKTVIPSCIPKKWWCCFLNIRNSGISRITYFNQFNNKRKGNRHSSFYVANCNYYLGYPDFGRGHFICTNWCSTMCTEWISGHVGD